MSNTNRLRLANLLDPTDMTPEQLRFIDQNLTPDEVRALICAGTRLHGLPGAAEKQPRCTF